MKNIGPSNESGRGAVEFTTTHWSVVLQAGDEASPHAAEALELLCGTYWPPLYAYLRRQGHDPHECQDLVQEFFARMLRKDYLGLADPARGRFRTFLLSSLKNFLINEWKRGQRDKRGAGRVVLSLDATEAEAQYLRELAEELTPERLFERRWVTTLLERVLGQLGAEYGAMGAPAVFEQLKRFVWGEEPAGSYAEIGAGLGMSQGAVKVAVHRLRQRLRETLRAEIAQTAATPAEVEAELRYLIRVMSEPSG